MSTNLNRVFSYCLNVYWHLTYNFFFHNLLTLFSVVLYTQWHFIQLDFFVNFIYNEYFLWSPDRVPRPIIRRILSISFLFCLGSWTGHSPMGSSRHGSACTHHPVDPMRASTGCAHRIRKAGIFWNRTFSGAGNLERLYEARISSDSSR